MTYRSYLGTAKQWKRRAVKGSRVVKRTLRDRYLTANKRGASSLKYGQLYKDVMMLKNTINAEKKYIDTASVASTVGQYLNGASGELVLDISPVIAQGNAYNQRNGISIKLNGLYLRLQFLQQTNTVNQIKIHIDVLYSKGKPQSTADVLTGMYDVDNISGMRDYNAPRNPNQFGDYQLICSRKCTLKPDSIAGQTGITNMQIPLKLNRHMRWDTAGILQEGQVFMYIRADNGDKGAPLTGVSSFYTTRFSYFDN